MPLVGELHTISLTGKRDLGSPASKTTSASSGRMPGPAPCAIDHVDVGQHQQLVAGGQPQVGAADQEAGADAVRRVCARTAATPTAVEPCLPPAGRSRVPSVPSTACSCSCRAGGGSRSALHLAGVDLERPPGSCARRARRMSDQLPPALVRRLDIPDFGELPQRAGHLERPGVLVGRRTRGRRSTAFQSPAPAKLRPVSAGTTRRASSGGVASSVVTSARASACGSGRARPAARAAARA